METTTTTETTNPLVWVMAAGGPEVSVAGDGRTVVGLPEEWWVYLGYKVFSPLQLHLHVKHTEPVTGLSGTLLLNLDPIEVGDGGVRWNSAFLVGIGEEGRVPARGNGTVGTFDEARAAALAWRPVVDVIDGVELWSNPEGCGRAELHSGSLEWTGSEGLFRWGFKSAGINDVLSAAGGYSFGGITGESATLEQMLVDVDAARERVRSAMRKFLLSF